ncbi:hypothetical protein D1872_282560 [compost metagenome]
MIRTPVAQFGQRMEIQSFMGVLVDVFRDDRHPLLVGQPAAGGFASFARAIPCGHRFIRTGEDRDVFLFGRPGLAGRTAEYPRRFDRVVELPVARGVVLDDGLPAFLRNLAHFRSPLWTSLYLDPRAYVRALG